MKRTAHSKLYFRTASLATAMLALALTNITPVRAQTTILESTESTSQSVDEARARVKAAEIDLKRAKAKLAAAKQSVKNKASPAIEAEAVACKKGGESCTDWGSVCCPGLMCAGGLNAICIPRN